MQTPTFRIVGPSGATLADDLPIQAPAIQLHEGTIAANGGTPPKNLKPGESVEVRYPLDVPTKGARPLLRCTVTRTDVPEGFMIESSSGGPTRVIAPETTVDFFVPSPTGLPPMPIAETAKNRGGRRKRGGRTS